MHNSHSSFELNFHLVFVTKYRKKFPYFYQFNWSSACSNLSDGCFQLVDIGFAKNHVHLLVIATGTEFNLAELANRLKTESSIFFKNLFPLSWPFWQTGFFVASVGKSSIKRVSKYLSKQS